MQYIPTNWIDGETSVNAENLNKLEQAVQTNDTAITEINLARETGAFKGDPGKSAYQYAQDGGYPGTEEEFARKMAEELPAKLSDLENDLFYLGREQVVSISKEDFVPLEDTAIFTSTPALGLSSDPAEIGYDLTVKLEGTEVHQTETDSPVFYYEEANAFIIAVNNNPAIMFVDGFDLAELDMDSEIGFVALDYSSLSSTSEAFTLSIYKLGEGKKIPFRLISDVKDFKGTGSFSMNREEGTAIGEYSHAEGYDTSASGESSHSEGDSSKARGSASHAEGRETIANGNYSHAEGWFTTASGQGSHAEGDSSTANGTDSHAEGQHTIADGIGSHAEGFYTIANGIYSHAQGRCNVSDEGNKYAHIVGNGENFEKRSNCHTLDWSGNAWFAGNVYIGGTGQDDPNAKKLVTADELSVAIEAMDKDSIVQEVIATLGTPVFGRVDEENNIILSGELVSGTYNLKYENADGSTTNIGTLSVSEASKYTNLANPSDSMWETNKRINSSGSTVAIDSTKLGDQACVITNIVDVSNVEKLYVKGLDIVNKLASGENYGRVYFYGASDNYIFYAQPSIETWQTVADYDSGVLVIDVDAAIADSGKSGITKMRLGGILTGAASDVIITADEQIV